MTRGELTLAMLDAVEKPWHELSLEERQLFSSWLDPSLCLRCGGHFACTDCGLAPAPLQRAAGLYLLLHATHARGRLAAQREALRGSAPPPSPSLQRALNGRVTPVDEIETLPPPPRGSEEEES